MTRIIIFKDSKGLYTGFECNGHAEFAKHPGDRDVVCAAVSVLTINTINSLDQLLHCQMDIDADENSGYMKMTILSDVNADTELLMKSLVLGLTSISNEYGSKFVKVIVKEV